jgi:transcriptional regulator with XRE-family HTH domain
MSYIRKNVISKEQLEIIDRIAKQVKKLRTEKDLSIERFCSMYQIPRITYGNLERGKTSFQITTLLSVINAHDLDLKKFMLSI